MRVVLFPLTLIVGLAPAGLAWAQAGPAGGSGAASGSAGASAAATSGAAASGGTTSTTTTVFPVYPGAVAPTPPGKPLGGGNISSSSSMPRQGDETDHFDLGPKSGGAATAHGAENGPVFLGGSRSGSSDHIRGGPVPDLHTVREGDTLWDLCDNYFDNPYQWPRIWSFNPQIQNPHWIYPGDQVRLRSSGINVRESDGSGAPTGQRESPLDKRRRVPSDTVFLRDQGFVDDKNEKPWGEISGSPVDKMFLSDFDELYVKVEGQHDVKPGQELTIYRPVRNVPGGKLVQIQGTVKVDQWNPKERIARAQVTETLDVIERGASIGPVDRKFTITPPQRNSADVKAKILASIHTHEFYGQNQVVFIDKGEKDGLALGNRLFVVRKGDAWKSSLATGATATRIALESDSPAEVERVPTPKDDKALPEEVVGELRVVGVREHSATCIVTQSRREIEPHEEVVARKGY
jgi:hypothetical protein